MDKIKVALVDDHKLLRSGLANLIDTFDEYDVVFQADNGISMQQELKKAEEPDILLLDIDMPEMNGYETALWLKENAPNVKILALSMHDNEEAITRMLQRGARGYILKDTDPQELTKALQEVSENGYYFNDLVSGRFLHRATNSTISEEPKLTEREIQFLKLAASEMTYKDIAAEMGLSSRTIDGYRDALFIKLDIKSRVGLVLYAIKYGIVKV
ncbi:DNA-binding response regulator [Chitinophaga caeni]|uniref:DNA-binding response regulator n=1 Tax=Chitinophaga caeni TaxID=2029983 RepID=A0A291R1K4_9BACT|nr:response regulator transcription factor [Chitinophaga caeni]ATL49983.1 DNA-binding response regulator [Chitinophaga caeni]